MAVQIVESNMTFGPFPDDHFFYIEKSETYQKIQKDVKIAEFLLLKNAPPTVLVVEAKSSSPKKDFDGFIAEIRDKLINAFSLGLASFLKRHPSATGEVPDPFMNLNLSAVDFRLVLVINGHKDAWFPPLQDALAKVLHPTVKTWALSPTAIQVLNDGMARKKGLIV